MLLRLIPSVRFDMSMTLQEKVTLASLPQEVKITILAHSHDLDSLLSARAACRTFYAAFLTAPSSLTRAVVSREIGVAVLPEAIQTLKASALRSLPDSDLPAVVFQLLDEDREALLDYRWSLADGIAAVRLHATVDLLTSEFASYYLHWLQVNSKCEKEGPPSMHELARIKRALYRFETYCSLFLSLKGTWHSPKGPDDFDFKAVQVMFLHRFSPWEREQLASAHESLWRLVAPAFNDLAVHDIVWGKEHVTPEKAWIWSHMHAYGDDLEKAEIAMSNEIYRWAERACGYVFWSEERLDKTGLLDRDLVDTPIRVKEEILEMSPTFEEQNESWKAREALWANGIRGYWDKREGLEIMGDLKNTGDLKHWDNLENKGDPYVGDPKNLGDSKNPEDSFIV
ncbi:hypothetical protein UCREL1_10477 [Eutypa lata UCREL1]|uniref:F-box domain-containing protein n=1 Tax=Eutypa lata (strain UCR-EL1) TaxID=1287681 RepID=M7SEK8_EUTLA|nr:hypothetical protein UCREL1_10477 [Eutypa lata UCREL1]